MGQELRKAQAVAVGCQMRDLQAFAPTSPKSLSRITAPPGQERPKRFMGRPRSAASRRIMLSGRFSCALDAWV
jgi:hypothetical protein